MFKKLFKNIFMIEREIYYNHVDKKINEYIVTKDSNTLSEFFKMTDGKSYIKIDICLYFANCVLQKELDLYLIVKDLIVANNLPLNKNRIYNLNAEWIKPNMHTIILIKDKVLKYFKQIDTYRLEDNTKLIPLCLCKFDYENMNPDTRDKSPFKKDGVYVFIGEISNMKGHGIFMDHNNTKDIYSGYHMENFIKLTDDEL